MNILHHPDSNNRLDSCSFELYHACMTTGVLFLTLLAQLAQIEGRVFMAGGNQAVPFARVAVVQSGQPVNEQYTDSLGRFGFSLPAQGR
ncbi:MAG: hypothetical protein DMG11_32225, partial [Acidobacteria bacterium]